MVTTGPTERGSEPVGAAPLPEDDLLMAAEGTAGGLLRAVVDVAVGILPSVSGASVSVARTAVDVTFETAEASPPETRVFDEVQYRSGTGPCVHAVRSGSEVRAVVPAAEWPDFSALAEKFAVRAVWSLPFEVRDGVGGALNLYSTGAPPWEAPSSGAAGLLAGQAAIVLAHAAALAQCEHMNLTLQRALETRTTIGQAQGVLMARQSIGAEEAFDILRRASQRTNRKLRDVAAELVAGVDRGHHAPSE